MGESGGGDSYPAPANVICAKPRHSHPGRHRVRLGFGVKLCRKGSCNHDIAHMYIYEGYHDGYHN